MKLLNTYIKWTYNDIYLVQTQNKLLFEIEKAKRMRKDSKGRHRRRRGEKVSGGYFLARGRIRGLPSTSGTDVNGDPLGS